MIELTENLISDTALFKVGKKRNGNKNYVLLKHSNISRVDRKLYSRHHSTYKRGAYRMDTKTLSFYKAMHLELVENLISDSTLSC